MSHFLTDAMDGASLGGVVGGALGILFAGTTLCLPGVNVVVTAMAATAAAATTTVSGAAAGTVIGAMAGGISGAVKDRKLR